MSGINTTPWHLTIGNPYSPILSMANIVVDTVNVEGSGELGYNDMPKRLKYSIKCHVGRNLGGQEIMQMFNNSYFRVYSKDSKIISAAIKPFSQPIPIVANKDMAGNPGGGSQSYNTNTNDNQTA
jgi:hypothetical protein